MGKLMGTFMVKPISPPIEGLLSGFGFEIAKVLLGLMLELYRLVLLYFVYLS